MLKFDPAWRFSSPGSAPVTLTRAFYDFIEKIASQGNSWGIVESFKEAFGSSGSSSSLSWAWSDLDSAMRRAEENAPLFIEAFYNVCVECADNGLAVPDVSLINRTLAEHGAGYRIEPPHLIATNPQARPIPVPDATPSLEAEARALIEESLKESHWLLDEGKGRQAVTEILWLLESVATVFHGTGTSDGTVQGKYFNKIIGEMKAGNRGKAQEQILDWMTKLHGYLSSPTGGGVRHGIDLKAGIAIQENEARLYCNLIRSYIIYLIEEHERLQKGHAAA
ncbi:hypothetical protein [Rhizobium gallicum]|uniref:hypothetical protein n=1 Tax=Rhizobium gallicum TaxID=56730 RepID=UPI001EF7EB53|nr:hypothetical protein [Rhizobium gallicum]ULJ74503.1 hypothetical protein L2W42_21920 [Rhizobium gallicum]